MRHLAADDIDRFRSGELSGNEALDFSRHLRACADCSALARNQVAGDLERVSRDLLPRSHDWKPMAAAAAAILLIALGAIVMVWRKPAESGVVTTASIVEPRGYGRADWNAQVEEARRSGRVEMPATIRDLHRAPDVLRGAATSPQNAVLEPVGEAVETQQPRFHWAGAPAGSYVVHVFAGRDEVARSPKLSATAWTPEKPLPRGATYAWQVEIVGRDAIIPSPPASPALFHVIDEKAARDIAEAQRRFPGDHLLIGVLCAHAGVRRCATSELSTHATNNLNDQTAQQLAASVKAW